MSLQWNFDMRKENNEKELLFESSFKIKGM